MSVGPLPIAPYRRLWLYGVVASVLFFLVAPIFIVIPISFSDSEFLEFPPRGFSLRWYAAYFSDPQWMAATRVSLIAASLTVLFATPLGTAAAYAIHRAQSRWVRSLHVLMLLPQMVPLILIGIGLFYVYIQLGLVNSMLGIVLAHTLLATPFVVVTVLAGLQSFDMTQEKVARSLGASWPVAFFTVTLPQIRLSVVSGAFFAFITSLDEVVIGLFVAGGDNTVLTRRMFLSLRDQIEPTIAAISSLLIVITLAALIAVALFARKAD
ncbi:ABC transporter permease [Stappia taiwanensis]|uniref:ABC transporter permease n=1 Tax=Stappia taiwanensis TaxID=992267 RepID=A0A838XRM5_9HYPH|nr:ABC transporter permease [Stappia taiwanensis]MBA4611328.1 ABC transporter permease [Stappia taiwanensis]GGE87840.1 ABC transporter permease [Stappia taiwanensis]